MKLATLRECWRARRADAGVMSLFALFFVCFFSWLFFGGKLLVGGDAFVYNYPLRTAAWDAIRSGSLPLWTPTVFSGYPLLSMSQLALGYPLTWGYALLPGGYAEELFVLAPFLLAPAFTYAYARQIGRSRVAALLAGLSFAYGGVMVSPLTTGGMQTNALMWLPLVLVAAERARTHRFVPCLVGATAAYSMSVLTGHGQSFLYAGLLANAYGAFLSFAAHDTEENLPSPSARAPLLRKLRPLAVTACGTLCGAFVGAFQILETLRAQRRSIRAVIDYEYFASGSFSPRSALWTLVAPLYMDKGVDVTTYVPPLALALALFCVARHFRAPRGRDARVTFWAAIIVAAVVLMLGGSTPLGRLLFRVPLLNLFRYPSRHAFEWGFALSVLAAYGWDGARASFERATLKSERHVSDVVIALTCLVAVACVGFFWWRATGEPPGPGLTHGWYTGLPRAQFLIWKAVFVALASGAVWAAWRVRSDRWRAPLAALALAAACFFEPFIEGYHFWHLFAKEPARFRAEAATTRFLRERKREPSRAYLRVDLDVEEFDAAPRVDGPNVPSLYGVENVGGFEHLILARYSRALGNVWSDGVSPRPGFSMDANLLDPRSHVLDLLNTDHLVAYRDLAKIPPRAVVKNGVTFAAGDLGVALAPRQTLSLEASRGSEGDTLALVTTMSNSVQLRDGDVIARLRVTDEGGRVVERELRAGDDTAEWAHERADVRAGARHRLATVFDSAPGDEPHSFDSYRYLALVPLGERVRVARVEIVNVDGAATLNVSRASLHDSSAGRSRPISKSLAGVATLDAARWRAEYDDGVAVVWRNARALPRAWLVREVESVDGEEALRRIRGEGGKDFDPRRTALLEVKQEELPRLTAAATRGGEAAAGGARVAEYEPSRLVVETDATAPSVLVVSEIFYPGWEATVDGAGARVDLADYLLRAVAVPAGRHRVEMRYRAPAARNGAIVSALTVVLLIGLSIWSRRGSRVGRKSVGG
ncbi:MAG: YfhO family protein [Acidobacteria bacterium]|nr:YfhO family protein [Acidobacteriota bacterium]MCA1643133.1 YfhO family protein [Acidobacteriota bacterium]